MRKSVNLFVLIIVCIVPLIINPWAYDYFYGPKINVIYILCATLTLFYILKNKKEKHKDNILDYLIFSYLILVLISTIFSIDFMQSLTGAAYRREGFAAIACYVFIYYFTSKYYTFSEKHLRYLIISSLIISIYGIAQFCGYDPIPRDFIRKSWSEHSFSTIGNRNFLGSYLTLIIPIIVFSYIHYKKIIYLFASCVLYLCLLCTLTRSAWLAFIAYMFLIGYYLLARRLQIKRFISIVGLFLIITVGFNTATGGIIFGRFLSIGKDITSTVKDSSDSAGSQRIFIWKRAIELVGINPILGSGPDTFGNIFMEKYLNDVVNSGDPQFIDKAHNEYLQIAVTTGIPSLILYLSFITTLLVVSIKFNLKRAIVFPLLCSVVGYLVQAFFNISVVSVAPIFWIMLGVLSSITDREVVNV